MSGDGNEGQSLVRPSIKRFSLDDLVVLLVSAGIGIPLSTAGADALVHGQLSPAALGFGLGLPLILIGATFSLWKTHVAAWLRDAIVTLARFGFPVLLLIGIVYLLGPYLLPSSTSPRPDEFADALVKCSNSPPHRPSVR
jgi:ABC-type amino acid transport system permease subunit